MKAKLKFDYKACRMFVNIRQTPYHVLALTMLEVILEVNCVVFHVWL